MLLFFARYERTLFGMKISDAMSLAKCVRATASLTTLSLQCCMIDDDLLRMLMTGLIRNQTVTALDLSHNNITNYGVRLLSKLLGSKSVVRVVVLVCACGCCVLPEHACMWVLNPAMSIIC